MQGLRIIFKTDPTEEEPHQDWRAETQKRHVNNLLPVLVKNNCSFHFYHNLIRETEQDSLWPELIVHTKCYWSNEEANIRKALKGISDVTIDKYPVCEAPECYERIAGEKLLVPLFDRHGTEDDNSTHVISECCESHLNERDSHIASTIETLDETQKKDHEVYIHVFPLWRRWIAQRVWQKWNYDGWENPNIFPYLVASSWIVGKTKELAIQAARDYEER